MEILSGLHLSSVHRLRKTWRNLPVKVCWGWLMPAVLTVQAVQTYENLNTLMTHGKNHKRYRCVTETLLRVL